MSNDKKEKKQPTGDYPVGYARAPRGTQFRQGQSGNPKGSKGGKRKRKAPSRDELRDDFFELMESLVTVKVNGVEMKMKTKDALMRQLVAKALSGDFRALKLALERYAGNIDIEEALREAQKNAIPDKIQVRFVKSDGNGGLHPNDRDLAPGYQGPKPNLVELKQTENGGLILDSEGQAVRKDSDDDDDSWLDGDSGKNDPGDDSCLN